MELDSGKCAGVVTRCTKPLLGPFIHPLFEFRPALRADPECIFQLQHLASADLCKQKVILESSSPETVCSTKWEFIYSVSKTF
jgi:hypothetical protein